MKRIVPVLLSLASCTLLFSQISREMRIGAIQDLKREAPPAVEAVANTLRVTQAQVLLQQDAVLKAKGEAANSAALADAQAKLLDAQKRLHEAAQSVTTPAPVYVSKEQRAHLVELTESFHGEVKAEAKSASSLALTLLIAGVGFGLASAVFSIFSWNKAAAVASALVVVLGGAQKLYPAQARATYYQTLTNQSYSLVGKLQIPWQMSVAEYDDGVSQLKILQEYRAEKYPASGDIEATTQSLFRDLAAAAVAGSTK